VVKEYIVEVEDVKEENLAKSICEAIIPQSNEMPLKDYGYPGPLLGTGSYKKVHLGKRWATDELVAIGKMDKTFIKEFELEEEIEREIEIFSILSDHPLMIKYIGQLEDNDYIYQIFEYCKNGTLKQLLTNKGFFDVELTRAFTA
jgi:serine/threonine protein kinase